MFIKSKTNRYLIDRTPAVPVLEKTAPDKRAEGQSSRQSNRLGMGCHPERIHEGVVFLLLGAFFTGGIPWLSDLIFSSALGGGGGGPFSEATSSLVGLITPLAVMVGFGLTVRGLFSFYLAVSE